MSLYLSPATCAYCPDQPLDVKATSEDDRDGWVQRRQLHLVCPTCGSTFVQLNRLECLQRLNPPAERKPSRRGQYSESTADAFEAWITRAVS